MTPAWHRSHSEQVWAWPSLRTSLAGAAVLLVRSCDAAAAWARLGVQAAWVGVLWLAWSDGVAHALIHPVSRSASLPKRSDALIRLVMSHPFARIAHGRRLSHAAPVAAIDGRCGVPVIAAGSE